MRFAWLAGLCLLIPAFAAGRPYTVEDMLAASDYGRALFSPSGDLVVVERLGGQRSAVRFTYDYYVRRARSRVMVASVSGTGGLKPLFAQQVGAGYWIAGFSPSGRRLAVYRLWHDRISLGIVDLATHRVRWLGVTPDQPQGAANPVWVGEDRLLAITLAPGQLPLPLDFAGRAQKQLPAAWSRTARGRIASMSVLGSGIDLQAGVAHRRRRLVLIDLATSAVRTLASGDFIDLAAAPDRHAVALLERGEAVPAPPEGTPLSLDFQSRRLRLRIVSLDGKLSSPCPGCDLAPDLLAWSGDGERLLYFARADQEPWEKGVLQVLNRRSGAVAPLDTAGVLPSLVRTTPGRATVRAGWRGNRPLLLGSMGPGRDDWFLLGGRAPVRLSQGVPLDKSEPLRIGPSALCLMAAGRLWSLEDDGTAVMVGKADHLSVVSDPGGAYDIGSRPLFEAVRDTPVIWLRRSGGSAGDLVEADCGGGTMRVINRLANDAQIVAAAPKAGTAIVLHMTAQGVGTLSLVGRSGRVLDRINRQFGAIDRPEAVPLNRAGRDGPLTDWLLLPPHAKPAAKLPLVLMPYPGTIFGSTPPSDFSLADFTPELAPALLAAHGYAVLEPSLPVGTAEPVVDIMSALRPAIAAAIGTGRIDPARIGVLGHSYGGYTALLMATELPCLRSVVASASVSDLLLMYGTLDPRVKFDFEEGLQTIYPFSWAEDGQGRMGVPPWRDPALYLRNSPFYRLDRVAAPILLLHGDLDPLSVNQAERTYAALYRLGKDARLVRFYGEGHVPASPATIRARWRETFAWFDGTMAARPGRAGVAFEAAGGCAGSRP